MEVNRRDLAVGVGREAGVGSRGGPIALEEAIVEGSGEVRQVDFDGSAGLQSDRQGSDFVVGVGEEKEESEAEGEEKGGEREEESGD